MNIIDLTSKSSLSEASQPIFDLFHEAQHPYYSPFKVYSKIANNTFKSFAEAVNNVCNILISQLLIPYVKCDMIDIEIPEDEYHLGLEACKYNLHDRIIWAKGSSPITVVGLRTKLCSIVNSIGKWGITSMIFPSLV